MPDALYAGLACVVAAVGYALWQRWRHTRRAIERWNGRRSGGH